MAKITTVSLDKAFKKSSAQRIKKFTGKSSLSKSMDQYKKMIGLPTKRKAKKKNIFGF